MTTYLDNLTRAVEAMHGCKCAHLSACCVREIMNGKLVWQGFVQTFGLDGHEKAKRAFAWVWDDDGETRYNVVLNVPPINSPREAVQATIARGEQP